LDIVVHVSPWSVRTHSDQTPTVLKQGPEGEMDSPTGTNPGDYNSEDGWG